MMNEQEYREEERHLARVLRYLEQTLSANDTNAVRLRDEIIDERRRMWDDFPHAGLNPEDMISMTQANEALRMSTEQYERMDQLKYVFLRMLDAPYFARLDFREDGYDEAERLYIGLYSLIDKETSDVLVCDWRADVSSMYYDAQVGRASYHCPMGTIEGDLLLRRQFQIENGKLIYMFDNDIAVLDEFLRCELGKNADDKMKTIVNTIQREQNDVIRELSCDLLLVQGTAGSGKTSVALHRLAYLLYKYRKSVSAKNILVFSPSSVFNAYIADVLPYLGEERVVQTDFYTFFADVLGCDAYPFPEQTEALLKGDADREETVRLKGSEPFARALETYYNENLRTLIPLRDLIFWNDRMIYTEQELCTLFFEKYAGYPVEVRKRKMIDCMLEEVQERYFAAQKLVYKRELTQNGLIAIQDNVLEVEAQARWEADLDTLTAQMDEMLSLDAVSVYETFLREYDPRMVSPSGPLPYEDIFPVVFLMILSGKIAIQHRVTHVVVDEAQDYTPLQYILLARLFPAAKMTILGDAAQSLHSHVPSIAAIGQYFNAKKSRYVELNKSYRSTAEINLFAQQLRPQDETGWFLRHGKEPELRCVPSLPDALIETAEAFRTEGMQSVMILTRTRAEAVDIWNAIREKTGAILIEEDDVLHTGEISVLPVYLAKGLETDAAIVAGVGEQWSSERDRQLLYVACTRPLHRLALLYTGTCTPLLHNCPDKDSSSAD